MMYDGDPTGRPGRPSALDPADTARRTSELASAELRYGRPVVLTGTQAYAAIALDTVSSEDYERFAAASGGDHHLYLTPDRASALKLSAPSGALVPLRDVAYEEAVRLGYRMGGATPDAFSPAPTDIAPLTRLSSLALLLPALVVTRIEAEDPAFEGVVRIAPAAIAEAAATDARYEIMARTTVPLRDVKKAEFVVFRGGLAQRDQLAIVVGDPDVSKSVPIRIHSSCLTGDLFGSLKCDCGDQLREGLRLIEARGGGVLVYLDQEGRGTGIGAKMLAYGFQHQGLDTIDADAALGFGPDGRRYGAAVAMLKALGISSVEIFTNNPTKAAFLEKAGIAVTRRSPVFGEVTNENRNYLATKASRAGHAIDVTALAAALQNE